MTYIKELCYQVRIIATDYNYIITRPCYTNWKIIYIYNVQTIYTLNSFLYIMNLFVSMLWKLHGTHNCDYILCVIFCDTDILMITILVYWTLIEIASMTCCVYTTETRLYIVHNNINNCFKTFWNVWFLYKMSCACSKVKQ